LDKVLIVLVLFATMIARAGAATPIAWHTTWSDALFAQAAKEHRFVLLDLHAVWCHWCHVMDETTYADDKVEQLVALNYLPVSVDADSDPDLTSRYGDWGWPATIVLAADGTEIVKRRGYLPPQQMASLLQAIVDDPSPGPSVQDPITIPKTDATQLMAKQRAALRKTYSALYDNHGGGWGRVHKLIDAEALELSFVDADSRGAKLKSVGEGRARQTLDNNLLLIDPVWGGVYQYSDAVNWRSPHFEKLLSYQADDLRLYAEAYARWHDPRYLTAAKSLFGYIDTFLSAPDGGFFVSQDADLSNHISGRDFYSRDEPARRMLGMPRVDKHEYTRETGWAIRALAKFYDVTGDERSLHLAENGARWALANRRLPNKGFLHDQHDRGGPFLDDNLAMSQAFLALYRSTGDRTQLADAISTLEFIDTAFRDADGGFFAAQSAAQSRGVFRKPVRLPDQNAALARAANIASRYTGNPRYREVAGHCMKYLVAVASLHEDQLLPSILLADRELSMAPIHIAIVGAKADPDAQSLHRTALRYPADYLQIDWLDRAEGDLPNPDIQYPDMKRAAAFACANGACSSPVFEARQIDQAVRKALLP
jgi:uncharacterized protein YyaL (SSP411 family)